MNALDVAAVLPFYLPLVISLLQVGSKLRSQLI